MGLYYGTTKRPCVSPSTRRAWIEIMKFVEVNAEHIVALHPEGVDRNDVYCS